MGSDNSKSDMTSQTRLWNGSSAYYVPSVQILKSATSSLPSEKQMKKLRKAFKKLLTDRNMYTEYEILFNSFHIVEIENFHEYRTKDNNLRIPNEYIGFHKYSVFRISFDILNRSIVPLINNITKLYCNIKLKFNYN
eukprot:418293_1